MFVFWLKFSLKFSILSYICAACFDLPYSLFEIKMSEKRKRSPNWLLSEKYLLLDLVEKHFSVIENKKTDGVSVKTKLAEWQIISVKYNSQTSHCHRDAENLKSQWECMKKAAKKKASNARMQMIQTGGGPPDSKKEDPINSRIISLIKLTVVGLYNPYDNDSAVPVCEDTETVTATGLETEIFSGSTCDVDLNYKTDQPLPHPLEVKSNDVQTNESVEYEAKDWGDYTPQLLRTPVSAPLHNSQKINKSWMSKRRPTYRATSSSLEQLHKKKIEAINFQKELASKERDHENTMAGLDIKIKEEILKQEKLKTRLLILDLRIKKKELQIKEQ